MKTVMSFVTEGAPEQFCVVLPRGAEIRQVAGKTVPNKFGVGMQTFIGLFIEGEADDDYPQEYRTFGWVSLGEPIGGEQNLRAIYRGALLGVGGSGEIFLYEYPDVQPTKEMVENTERQRAAALEARRQSNSPILLH